MNINNLKYFILSLKHINFSISENNLRIQPLTLKDWIRQNSILIWFVLIFAVIIVIIYVRRRELHYRKLASLDLLTGLWNSRMYKAEADKLLNGNKETDCDMVQGFLYSKPLPLDVFEKLL